MVNMSFLVEKIIEQKPFLQEALSKGIVNNAALAEQLMPELEQQLKNKVKFSAVNMAIRRLSEKLENDDVHVLSVTVAESDRYRVTYKKNERR